MSGCGIELPGLVVPLEQGKEWIWLDVGLKRKRVRLHDYGTIYGIPGLYERIFCETLKYRSPEVIADMLCNAMNELGEETENLRVLDFGAGNGMVGEVLSRQKNCELIIGVDVLLEAKKAAGRDRPGVYDEYYVVDMSELAPDERASLRSYRLNCLVTVGALGFGDIPTCAFVEAFNLIKNRGWIAFNIKNRFLDGGDDTGYAKLLRGMLSNDILYLCSKQRYPHRLSISGEELHYIAVVGRKKRDIRPDDLA